MSGGTPEREKPEHETPERILFVCTGNTCRSPMAAALLVHLARERGLNVAVASAGTGAVDGGPAMPEAVAALKEWGIDLAHHRSCRLTPADLAEADLVLTMTRAHKAMVQLLAPDSDPPVYTLNEYLQEGDAPGESNDIPDPIGQSLEAYRRCAGELRRAVLSLLDRLEGKEVF